MWNIALSPGGERGAMFSFIARGAMPKQMVSLYGEQGARAKVTGEMFRLS
jgi:hypothetical protein